MNERDLTKYFSLRLTQLGLADMPPAELTKLVGEAIKHGKADLWHARQWSFRRMQYELTISSEQDEYELPDDCCAVAVAREQSSLYGQSLVYVSKDEFDRRVPYPSSHSGSEPQLCTVYENNKKKYIQFYPRPDITPIYLSYLLNTPTQVDRIPDVARAALMAVIGKYLYRLGTPEYLAALQMADMEIRKLEVQDTPLAEDIWKFFDDTDVRIEYTRPWV